MRSRFFLTFTGFLLAWPAHSAERWSEYTYPEDGFSATFPGKPVIAKRFSKTSQSPNRTVPERIYSVNEGGVIYSISVMDFTKAEADPDVAVGEVASALTGLGRVAFDESIYTDSMHGREIVVIGDDGTSYTDGIFYVRRLLYQMKVVYPAVNSDPAGSSGISIFLTQFHFTNPF